MFLLSTQTKLTLQKSTSVALGLLQRTNPYHSQARSSINMATSYRILVSPTETGLLGGNQPNAVAERVSELLQKDMENHHVFFNSSGFHNHIPHHLLALYGTLAGVEDLDRAWAANANYQRSAKEPKESILKDLQSDYASAAAKYYGKEAHYADFLRFYQEQIERSSWQNVLARYVFNGDAVSDQLFGRLYAGFLHPMIQLMYGVEWNQPAIVAEALAQAAVHENRVGDFFLRVEEAVSAHNSKGSGTRSSGSPSSQPIAELLETIHKHDKLVKSAHWDDPNRIYDGVMKRAPDEAISLLSRISVTADRLEEATDEMFHTSAYMAAGAAFHPPNTPKYDFFLIHHLNSAPIFLKFNSYDWIPPKVKCRLLEWKIRLDIVQYIARGSPPLKLQSIKEYQPRDLISSNSENGSVVLAAKAEELLPRFHRIADDGHTIKVVRALLLAEQISRKYYESMPPWLRITDHDTWLKMHYVLLDSVEGQSARWVRSAGFEEAWKDIPKL